MSTIDNTRLANTSLSFGRWPVWIAEAVPVALRVLPFFLALTFFAAMTAILLLLTVGKTAFHLFSLASPLVFIIIAMSAWKSGMLPGSLVISQSIGEGSPWRRFFKIAAPLALVIGGVLNLITLAAMFGADLSAWSQGDLPRTTFPLELLNPEKRTLLVILYTTAVEQQLSLMPLFIVMGGRLEPLLVAGVIARRINWEQAFKIQASLSKREKLCLGPMRLLVLGGVCLQASARVLDATSSWVGVGLLLASICGWLFYCCLITVAAKDVLAELPKE
ncbi:hypothetical protein [Pseudomonas sp. LS-2]|uniref:hypothetical protein n=1 Tax=Pseudomonas sp. LS-2 TaxID=2315859 RepID=UPI000E760AB1|nr:hypothetical protein [Pseudomonas sp. LS-2]RJX72588.1 hypothetical protein D3M70_30765 [Pseudomonas sp. LS-2]